MGIEILWYGFLGVILLAPATWFICKISDQGNVRHSDTKVTD